MSAAAKTRCEAAEAATRTGAEAEQLRAEICALKDRAPSVLRRVVAGEVGGGLRVGNAGLLLPSVVGEILAGLVVGAGRAGVHAGHARRRGSGERRQRREPAEIVGPLLIGEIRCKADLRGAGAAARQRALRRG